MDVAQSVGVTDVFDGRSIALADFGNRGVLDAVVANQRGPALLYRNSVSPENRWIGFELEGSRSNRSAIGAQVTLFWNGQEQIQEVLGGSGFCAQNDRRLHFGLGKKGSIEKAVVRWPSGQFQTITSPQVNKLYKLKEPACHTEISASSAAESQKAPAWFSFNNRYLPPLLITCILLAGQAHLRLSRELLENRFGHRGGDGSRGHPFENLCRQMAASRERVYLRNQHWDSRPFSRHLAIRALQRDRHHIKVCPAGTRPTSLEPFELRICVMLPGL